MKLPISTWRIVEVIIGSLIVLIAWNFFLNPPKSEITAEAPFGYATILCKGETIYPFVFSLSNNGDKGTQIRKIELISDARGLIPLLSCITNSSLFIASEDSIYLNAKSSYRQCVKFGSPWEETLENITIIIYTSDSDGGIKQKLTSIDWMYSSLSPFDTCVIIPNSCDSQKECGLTTSIMIGGKVIRRGNVSD